MRARLLQLHADTNATEIAASVVPDGGQTHIIRIMIIAYARLRGSIHSGPLPAPCELCLIKAIIQKVLLAGTLGETLFLFLYKLHVTQEARETGWGTATPLR